MPSHTHSHIFEVEQMIGNTKEHPFSQLIWRRLSYENKIHFDLTHHSSIKAKPRSILKRSPLFFSLTWVYKVSKYHSSYIYTYSYPSLSNSKNALNNPVPHDPHISRLHRQCSMSSGLQFLLLPRSHIEKSSDRSSIQRPCLKSQLYDMISRSY